MIRFSAWIRNGRVCLAVGIGVSGIGISVINYGTGEVLTWSGAFADHKVSRYLNGEILLAP